MSASPSRTHAGRDIVVVGASAGGVEALRKFIGALPADFPGSVFIVLHVWGDTKSMLAPILQRTTPLAVREPVDNEPIARGTVYVARPDLHMMIESDHIVIVRGPRENHARPAINPLFRSAAATFGPRVIGLILTGTLDDGSAGLWAVKRCGGIAIVQSDADFPDMPQNAREQVAIDHAIPLAEMAGLVNQLAREPVSLALAPEVPPAIQINNAAAQMKTNAEIKMDDIGQRSIYSCPECNGPLWEVDEGGQPQFRCHVGHAFSSGALRNGQQLVIEQSIWSALRALKESATLDERLAERTTALGLDEAADTYRRSASEKKDRAEHLLAFLGTFRSEGAPPEESRAG